MHDGTQAAHREQGVDWGRVFHPGKEAMMKTPVMFRHTLACLYRTAARCQQLLPGGTLRVRPPTHPHRGMPRHVRAGGMLVESDVTKGVRGILP